MDGERQGHCLSLESLYWTYDGCGRPFVDEELIRVSPAVDSIRECRAALDLPKCLQSSPYSIECYLQRFFCGAGKMSNPCFGVLRGVVK